MTLLHSKRLTLSSQLTETDLGSVVGWLNDPEVVKYSEQRHRKHTIETQYKYLMEFDPRGFYLGIHKEWKLIGTISAEIDRPNGVANVGMMIGERSLWGRGFGLEAWSCLCDHLLRNNVRKIEAGCMSINSGMMKICKRYGMVEEGRRKNHFVAMDTEADLVCYGRFYEPSPKLFRRRRGSVASAQSGRAVKPKTVKAPIGFVSFSQEDTGNRVRRRPVFERLK